MHPEKPWGVRVNSFYTTPSRVYVVSGWPPGKRWGNNPAYTRVRSNYYLLYPLIDRGQDYVLCIFSPRCSVGAFPKGIDDLA